MCDFNFYLSLPKNDDELNALIQHESVFLKKYHGISVTQENFSKWRDYVCESRLGLQNGAYNELQEIWKQESAKQLQDKSVSNNFLVELDDWPDVVYLNLPCDEEATFLSRSEDVDAPFMCSRGLVWDEDDFLQFDSEDQLFGLLSHYRCSKVLVEYPSGSKYGTPAISSYSEATRILSDDHGITSNDDLMVESFDRGDDGAETIIVQMRKR